MLYKVKNKAEDERVFIAHGQRVTLAPGESSVTSRPPEESEIFDVKPYEKKEERKVQRKSKDTKKNKEEN